LPLPGFEPRNCVTVIFAIMIHFMTTLCDVIFCTTLRGARKYKIIFTVLKKVNCHV
jgi:hypothetical protein